MLLPFQYSILTIEEARILISFIERATATKAFPRNYDKMQKMDILEMYNKLREFNDDACHYEAQLKCLDFESNIKFYSNNL